MAHTIISSSKAEDARISVLFNGQRARLSTSPREIDAGCILPELHCIFELFSKRIISWWCWFYNSFMKFWYFCNNLNKPTLTSHTQFLAHASATRTPARSSGVEQITRPTVSTSADPPNFSSFHPLPDPNARTQYAQSAESGAGPGGPRRIFLGEPRILQFYAD